MRKLTEAEELLIRGLKAFGVRKGAAMEIALRMETEEQQYKMMDYMVDHREATGEELLDEARRISEEETRDLLALHNMTADNLRGALKPVRQPKEFSKFGNGALQQLVSEVGVQELARINAERQE